MWPRDAIWRHRSGSTLVQGTACCLTAPSHHLNQYWLIITYALWHSSGSDSAHIAPATSLYNEFEHHTLKLLPHFPRANELATEICLFALTYRHELLQISCFVFNGRRHVKYEIPTISVNVPQLVQSLYSLSGWSSYRNNALSQSRSHDIGSYIDRTALKLNRHPDKWYIY